jgi:hypothetical protein
MNMCKISQPKDYSAYLVCGKYIDEVKDFLGQFFPERKEGVNYEHWITFEIPKTGYHFNPLIPRGSAPGSPPRKV